MRGLRLRLLLFGATRFGHLPPFRGRRFELPLLVAQSREHTLLHAQRDQAGEE